MSLYLVTDAEAKKGTEPRLIKANSAAAAVRHVTGSRFSAEVVSNAEKAADLITGGFKMEVAGEEPSDDTPPPASSDVKEETEAKS